MMTAAKATDAALIVDAAEASVTARAAFDPGLLVSGA